MFIFVIMKATAYAKVRILILITLLIQLSLPAVKATVSEKTFSPSELFQKPGIKARKPAQVKPKAKRPAIKQVPKAKRQIKPKAVNVKPKVKPAHLPKAKSPKPRVKIR